MNILISNDDGIDSIGLSILANKFKELGNVTVVAPIQQMSATSHALTTVTPLRIKEVYKDNQLFGYAVNGTPADCVKIGIISLMKQKPDLVLSGINFGRNTGVNVIYSGTIAAAVEGYLLGIPSFAISLTTHDTSHEVNTAADYAFNIITKVLNNKLTKDNIILSINIPAIPAENIKGIKLTELSNSYWDDKYEKYKDPFHQDYYWFDGKYIYDKNNTNTDDYAVENGYVAITPLQYSFTNYNQMNELSILETK
ncbi:MAG: 5'/3'-nucleotidase SurE [Bacteroidetes bacterium]|nr:5'/3'-nucleotidase SurE [Bacteroidota bacterium]